MYRQGHFDNQRGNILQGKEKSEHDKKEYWKIRVLNKKTYKINYWHQFPYVLRII